jgi:sulfite exporter TauE/SafE
MTFFATGLINGLGFCTFTCLPYLASYIASTGANFRKSIFISSAFNAGRVIGYTLIGALIGLFGGLIHYCAEDSVQILQNYSNLAFGIVTILIGVTLLYKNRKPSCGCNPAPFKPKRRFLNRFDMGAFALGLSKGLVFCPILMLILLPYSVLFTNPVNSVAFAFLFGLGTIISPMVLVGGVTGWLLTKADLLRKYISLAGSIVIILLGTYTLGFSIYLLA